MARRPVIKPVGIANINLWGARIGALSWDNTQGIGFFEYDSQFLESDIQLSPIYLPLAKGVYSFPALSKDTYKGLPGMLADSMPDKFGNAVINAWLIRQGRSINSFTPLERLCYIGTRGMGALEFEPQIDRPKYTQQSIEVQELVELANVVINKRQQLHTHTDSDLSPIIQVGTSAGGARAKAVIAWNPNTNEIRSGQINTPPDFEHWLIKFDGISNNRDKELTDPQGYGKIEFAYYQLAKLSGIEMNECQLLSENNRHHFITKRFDRTNDGEKIHMQTLCGLAHFDFNQAGSYSYEQAFSIMQQLGLSKLQLEEQFRRMVFNVMARNQDDHTKNISFLMTKQGKWKLAPAYDLTYSYNPNGAWTSQHQMSINGKRDHFELNDLIEVAKRFSIMKTHASNIIEQTEHALNQWSDLATNLKINEQVINEISKAHRYFS